MKIILFDLGNTLEDRNQEILLPGAMETLKEIRATSDSAGQNPVLALVSDFGEIPANALQIQASQKEYYAVLEQLEIRQFFEPVEKRVTLSIEVGVEKPKKQIFREAINRIDKSLGFQDVMFITENKSHIIEARALGMRAIHFKGPGQNEGDVEQLTDLIPLVSDFLD